MWSVKIFPNGMFCGSNEEIFDSFILFIVISKLISNAKKNNLMNEKLIIDENFPEILNLFYNNEVYLVEEKINYDEIISEGGNKYRFLNIISHNNEGMLTSEQKDFFFKMINAIRTDKITMDADGYSMINVYNYKGLTWQNIEKLYSPKYCVFWGVNPEVFKLTCKLYGGLLHNGCKIIFVDNMTKISNDVVLKRNLWNLIQRLFGMNKA